MYELNLSISLVEAQTDSAVLETTVGGLLRDAAKASPGRLALVEIGMDGQSGRRWTWAELMQDSERLARALATQYAPSERVCVWSPNTPEWVLMEYACALAGLTLVTANPAYQVDELRYVLTQSRSVGLFCVESYRGNPMADIAREATRNLGAIREIIDMDVHESLFALAGQQKDLPDVSADDAAQIQYTSGTTGFPKGAVLPHRALTNNARLFRDRCQMHAGSVIANFMPMFHTSGCGMATLSSVQRRVPMILFKTFDPVAVLKQIEAERITTFTAVPTMLIGMLDVLRVEDHDLSSLELIVSGGSMVPPELVRNVTAAMKCTFQTVYGQTECAPLITQHHMNETLEDICNTIGQPMPQTGVSIRSVPDNDVVPVGEIGEICVRGYCLMSGYNDNPEATAKTIDPAGWLHTGDLGRMDSRGYLQITGRVKEMIIRGGENYFPAEIENALLEHPAVSEIAIVGLPDEKWGEIISAFIRPETGHAVDIEDIRRHCRARLAPQKTPAVWVAVDAYPLTGSGKIQKFALRDGFLEGRYQPIT
ncbi:MAG: AMP-binding protein [Pseudomonadota bacterium]